MTDAAARFRMAIAYRNLTMKDVGEACNVSAMAVSNWCNGLCLPQASTLVAFSKVTGAPIDWIMSADDPFPVSFAARKTEYAQIRRGMDNVLADLWTGTVWTETAPTVRDFIRAYDKLIEELARD